MSSNSYHISIATLSIISATRSFPYVTNKVPRWLIQFGTLHDTEAPHFPHKQCRARRTLLVQSSYARTQRNSPNSTNPVRPTTTPEIPTPGARKKRLKQFSPSLLQMSPRIELFASMTYMGIECIDVHIHICIICNICVYNISWFDLTGIQKKRPCTG